jgi:hypothetical protein
MLWATLAPLLKSTITSLALRATDPLYSARFEAEYHDQRKKFTPPVTKASIDLKLTSSTDTFTEERSTFDPAANGGLGAQTTSLHGMRDFVLNVQCKSYDLAYAHWAHEYAERIRTRIQARAVRDALIGQNLTLVRCGAIIDLDGKEDGHAQSIANLDLFFRAGFEDATPGSVNWIESILLTSHVKNPAGVEYPAPPNVTDDLIPDPAP